jgi:hypothetical protein
MKNRFLPVILFLLHLQLPAHASGVQEAASEINRMNDGGPQAFTWMLVCIGLLVTLAATLMIVTVTYSFKRK